MPDPLPSDIVARLRSDSTAALAASLILAGSFPDIVSWALRAFTRTSTVLSLKRLEEAGLVEHPAKGVYRAVDQAPPPRPAWVEPLGGAHVARHAADGRVRDEMTMA